MIDRNGIEDQAVSLLLKQNRKGEFSLALLDYRHLILNSSAMVSSFESYEKNTGTVLPRNIDGLTVRSGSMSLILINESVRSTDRINWTVAHELGHVMLGHTVYGSREEHEADLFASSMLMPESVVRYLDGREGHRLSPREMKLWFAASVAACTRRRTEIDRKPPYCGKYGIELLDALFNV